MTSDRNIEKQADKRPLWALIVSVIFHPIFIPALSCLGIFYLYPATFSGLDSRILSRWFAMVILNTIIFPGILMLLLKGLGFIKSFHLDDSKERIIPLIGTMIFYFWAWHVVKNVHAPHLIQVLLLSCFWGIIGLFVIGIFFKISMHTTAIGAQFGMVIVLMLAMRDWMILPLLLVSAIAVSVGLARYALGAHTRKELFFGYALGIVLQLAAYMYL